MRWRNEMSSLQMPVATPKNWSFGMPDLARAEKGIDGATGSVEVVVFLLVVRVHDVGRRVPLFDGELL